MHKQSKSSALSYLKIIANQNDGAFKRRVSTLSEIIQEDGTWNLQKVLDKCFIGAKDQLDSFNTFKAEWKNKIDGKYGGLKIVADTAKKSKPIARKIWLESENIIDQGLIERIKEDASLGEGEHLELNASDGKKVLKYFVSYASKDKDVVDEFMEMLEGHAVVSKKFVFEKWIDNDIILGEDWFEEIKKAISECNFGLLLLSRSFFASDFIKNHEVKDFIQISLGGKVIKPFVPVGLSLFDLEGDLWGIEKNQIFLYPKEKKKGFFKDARTKKDEFSLELKRRIEQKFEKFSVTKTATTETFCSYNDFQAKMAQHNKNAIKDELGKQELVYTKARAYESLRGNVAVESNRVVAIDFINNWVTRSSKKYFALLGEYGMGKTITCKQFCLKVLSDLEENTTDIIPVYIDLRLCRLDQGIKIEPLIDSVLEASESPGSKSVRYKDIAELWESQKMVFIIDGLDEVLHHLNKTEQQQFLIEIWKLVPTKVKNEESIHKLLLSCRSDFFRTLSEQTSFFQGSERALVDQNSDWNSCVLLPFTEDQIKKYLSLNFPEKNTDDLYVLLGEVHNLLEASSRPVLLDFISSMFGDLENMRKTERNINIADIYNQLISRSFSRDGGKHEITPKVKEYVLEEFAALIWSQSSRSLSIDKIENELNEILDQGDPEMRKLFYQKEILVLHQDLRNATLLVREGEKNFRFSHTSIQEFFLARYILGRMGNEKKTRKQLGTLSRETYGFLIALIENLGEYDKVELEKAYQAILSDKDDPWSHLIFGFYLHFEKKLTHPLKRPERIQIENRRFQNLKLKGETHKLFKLSKIDFSSCHFQECQFEKISFNNTSFSNCSGNVMEMDECDLDQTIFKSGGKFRGEWRKCSWKNVRFENADFSELRISLPIDLADDGLFSDHVVVPRTEKYTLCFLNKNHLSIVNGADYSRDGSRIVSGGNDSTVKIWDADSGALIRSLEGHNGRVLSVSFSTEGSRIVSGGDDNTVKVWDADSGALIRSLEGHSTLVRSVNFSTDDSRIVSGGDDSTVKVWDADSGALMRCLEGHNGLVYSVSFSSDGSRIVSGGDDSTVKIWDADSGALIRSLEGHNGSVSSVSFSTDGSRIVSGGDDSTVKIWDADSGALIRSLEGYNGRVLSVSFSSDDSRIVSGGDDSTVKVWDANSGALIRSLEGHIDRVLSVGFSSDGSRIVSGGNDSTVKIWDADSRALIRSLEGHSTLVFSVSFSSDGSRIVSGGNDSTVKVWDANSGALIRSLEGHNGSVYSVSFSSDDSRIVSGGDDSTVKIWDADSGALIRSLEGHNGRVLSVSLSSDDSRIVSGGNDNTVKVWDADSGALIRSLEGHIGWVFSVSFSSDGSRIVSGGLDNTVKVWDADSGALIRSLEGHSTLVFSVSFSGDGSRIVSGGDDNTVKVWDANSGALIRSLEGHSALFGSVSFSSDGSRIVSGGKDSTVKIWDADSGALIRSLEGHSTLVRSVNFSTDGSRIVSGGEGGLIKVFDNHASQELKLSIFNFKDACASTNEKNELLTYRGKIHKEMVAYSTDSNGIRTFHPFDAVILND